MQTAPATATSSGAELIGHTASLVGARKLLEESERLWSADLDHALRCAGSSDSRHRRRLALEALAAYARLAESCSAVTAAVFHRWPGRTTLALAAAAGTQAASTVELARLTGPSGSDSWLAGRAEYWSLLTTDLPASLDAAPGVPLLSATEQEDGTPQLRLHPGTGAVTVVFLPGARGRGSQAVAGGAPSPVVEDRWALARPVRWATCHDVLGRVHRLHIVDAPDPLLVFDNISVSAPVPAGEVRIGHLGDPPSDAFDGHGVLEVAVPHVCWTWWWAGRISLSATTAIGSVVGHSSGSRYGLWRPGASAERADLEFDAPVPLWAADLDHSLRRDGSRALRIGPFPSTRTCCAISKRRSWSRNMSTNDQASKFLYFGGADVRHVAAAGNPRRTPRHALAALAQTNRGRLPRGRGSRHHPSCSP